MSSKFIQQVRRNKNGWVLLSGSLVIVVLFLFLGLGIDVGMMQFQKKRVQMAADSAAMAGTLELRNSTGNQVAAATTDAQLNGFVNGSNGVTLAVNNPPTSGPGNGDSNSLQVVVRRSVPTIFMQALGASAVTVSGVATGRVLGSGSSGASGCIYVMDPSDDRAMMLGGNSFIWSNCSIFVNSTAAAANGNGAMYNDGSGCYVFTGNAGINIVGGYSGSSGTGAPTPPNAVPSQGNCTGTLNGPGPGWSNTPAGGYNSGQNFATPALPSGISAPTLPTSCTHTNLQINSSNYTTFSSNGQLQPGTYCGGLTISGQVGTITMNPGLYIMVGGGFQINGGGSVSGSGVTIYNTVGTVGGTSYNSYEPFVFTSQGSNATLSAPTSGSYAGMLLWTDSSIAYNSNTNQVNGNSSTKLEGIIYMPKQPFVISGSSSTLNSTANYTQFVTYTLTVNGGGTLNMTTSNLPSGVTPIGSVAGASNVVLAQ